MNYRSLAALCLLAVPLCALAQKPGTSKPTPRPVKTAPLAPATLAGVWEGKLTVNAGMQLGMIFRLSAKSGVLSATLDVPDQAAKDIPVPTTTLTGRTLKLDLPALKGSYTGTVAADGQSIVGTWSQGMEFPLTLRRVVRATEERRPQTPKPPFSYRTEEVTVENTAATGVRLAGTLSLPEGAGPFPAVVFITGSGAQDRDEMIFQHRPFAVIADALARRGIASLRCDDRGTAKSTGTFATATTADFATDTAAQVAFLKMRPEIVPTKIGLIGHSEGGIIAPMVAAADPTIAFLVLLAGTGVPGDQVLAVQSAAIARVMGAPEAVVKASAEVNAKAIAIVRQEPDPKKATEQIVALIAATDPTADKKTLTAQAQALLNPWLRYFLDHDPAVALAKVTCPVLALNGSKDLQVLPDQNLPAIEKVLKEAGNRDVTTVLLPNVNHLFQTCTTGAPSEYRQIEETFSPDALERIVAWITEKAR
jgi:pimeloyl-ACP methyl ester carboxylesterase